MKIILAMTERRPGSISCGLDDGCGCHDSDWTAEAEGLPGESVPAVMSRSAGEALAELLSAHPDGLGLEPQDITAAMADAKRHGDGLVSEALIEALMPLLQERGIILERA